MAAELTNKVNPTADFVALCRATTEASPVPMAGLEGATHIIRYVNQAFCHLTGKSEQGLLGHPFPGVSPASEVCQSLLDRVYQTGEAETHSGPKCSPSEPQHWSYAVWPIVAGNPRTGIMLQVVEGTDLHQNAVAANEALTLSLINQQERREAAELARAELETEIQARKKMEDALVISEKLASVGRMAAVIAHEINNPLAAITDLLYLAQTVDGTPKEVLEYLETADGELKRVAHITRQTLGFYRELTNPTSFYLHSLLDSVVDLLQAKIRSKRAIVELRCDTQIQLSAMYGELRQVFSNLLVNSIDAMKEHGRVTIRASLSQNPTTGTGRIRISIADNGQGIAKATLPKIFDPFFTTKGLIGNGLGLWISKGIIEKHGGAVQVRSCTNGTHQGTTFSVILPAS